MSAGEWVDVGAVALALLAGAGVAAALVFCGGADEPEEDQGTSYMSAGFRPVPSEQLEERP